MAALTKRPFFIDGDPGFAKIIPKNMSQLISENQPLAPLTTWKIGGVAARLAAPADVEDVYRLMRLAQDRGWPLFFLGRGSNVLIADAGLPGLTIHLAKSLQDIERHGDTLRVGAGVALPRLAQAAARLGFAGFEFLAGIPGTVGAALRLNAGAEGCSLGGAGHRFAGRRRGALGPGQRQAPDRHPGPDRQTAGRPGQGQGDQPHRRGPGQGSGHHG